MHISDRAILLATLCRQMYRATAREEVWQVLLEGVCSVAAADVAVLYQLDPDGNQLYRLLSCGVAPTPAQITIPPYLLHDLRLLRQPLQFTPGQQLPPLVLALTEAIWAEHPPTSVVVLPFREQGIVQALCVCGWSITITDEHVGILQFLADDAMYAHAMLAHAEHTDYVNGISPEAMIDLTLLYTHTLDQLLEAALEQLIISGGAAAGAIYLYNDAAHELHLQDVKTHPNAAAFATILRQLWQADLGRQCRYLADSLLRSGHEVAYQVPDPSPPPELTALHTFLRTYAINGVLSIAILVGGWQAGVIQLAPWPGRGFSERQWQWLRLLVRQIGVAIEHSRLFEQLRTELDRAQAVVEATNDGIIMISPQRKIVIVNRRACYFLGIAEHDLKGHSYDDLLLLFGRVFANPARLTFWLSQLLGSETDRAHEEFQVVWPKPRRLLCFSAPVVDRREQYLGRILIFRDVTREREVEQMRNEFVSTVSHELRTPLMNAQGSLQLVLGDQERGKPGLVPNMPAKARELLQIALNNTNRLLRLVNDMLDIAKIERGQLQLQRKPVAPEEICRSAVDNLSSVARQHDITIDVEIAPNLPLIDVDRDRIVQVVVNLLSNAIKFSASGQRVLLSVIPDQAMVRFSVRDWGPGIARSDQEKLFKKFQQLDQSISRQKGGSGLGLAISRELVELHGGRIWVESEVGHGSTFHFTVPLAKIQRLPVSGQPPLVLVGVDQHPLATALQAELATIPDWEIVLRPTADLLTILPERQPAVVVLSHPENVDELLFRLRALPLYQMTPMIVIGDEAKGRLSKDVLFLAEPISTGQLIAAVREQIVRPKPLIMVVDDDPNVRLTLTKILQRNDFRVLSASSGEEALSLANHIRPHAILLDLRMPEIDGFEVLRRLRANPDTATIPVVVLTANDLGHDAPSQASALGANGFLEKPVSADRLIAALTSVIAGNEGHHG